jgi:hypothetical protein
MAWPLLTMYGSEISRWEVATQTRSFGLEFNFFKKDNYDFTKKNWGFYVSQSISQRVKLNNFTLYLVKNSISGRFYLLVKYVNKSKEFKRYLKQEKMKIIFQFSKKNLLKLEKLFKI